MQMVVQFIQKLNAEITEITHKLGTDYILTSTLFELSLIHAFNYLFK